MVKMRIFRTECTIQNREVSSPDAYLADFLNKAKSFAYPQPKHQDDPDLRLADYFTLVFQAEILEYQMPEDLRKLMESGAIL